MLIVPKKKKLLTRRTALSLLAAPAIIGLSDKAKAQWLAASSPLEPMTNLPVNGTVTWNGATYTAQTANKSYSASVSTTSGVNLGRFEVYSGDTANVGGERSEVECDTTYAVGTHMWCSYAWYMLPGWNFGLWQVIGQLHPSINGTGLDPSVDVNFNINGKLQLLSATSAVNPPLTDTQTVQYQSTNPITLSTWHYAVHEMIMDPSGAAGLWNCWIDGVQQVNFTGAIGYYANTPGDYWKIGIYRGTGPGPSSAYAQNLEFGTTNLAARIANPLPVSQGLYAG